MVITADKDGLGSVFEKELVDADVVISQPFWSAYLTADRIAKAPNLRLAITAGIGSDHVTYKPQSPGISPFVKSPIAIASALLSMR